MFCGKAVTFLQKWRSFVCLYVVRYEDPDMASFSEALALVQSTVDGTALVTNLVANTSTVPPGVAMIASTFHAAVVVA